MAVRDRIDEPLLSVVSAVDGDPARLSEITEIPEGTRKVSIHNMSSSDAYYAWKVTQPNFADMAPIPGKTRVIENWTESALKNVWIAGAIGEKVYIIYRR